MPFSILANKQIHEISLFTIRVIETQRIFDLIQQNVQNPKSIITIQNLQNFIQRYYPNLIGKANKIIAALDQQGVELNQQNFKYALAYQVKETQLDNTKSLINYYQAIKSFFNLKFSKKLQQIDRWDIPEPLTTDNIQKRLIKIRNFYQIAYPYLNNISNHYFQKYLQQINFCYTISAISDNQDDVLTVYQSFTSPALFDFLAQFLRQLSQNTKRSQINSSQTDQSFNFLKNIAHLYGACRYPVMKQKIKTHSCLFYHETYSILMSALRINDVKIRQQLMVCFALLSKYSDNFIQWICSDILQLLAPLLQQISIMKDQSNIYCSLVCIKNIIRAIKVQSEIFRNQQDSMGVILRIYQFSHQVLKKSQILINQRECIFILNQILFICNFPQRQIQEINIVNQIFSADQAFQITLVPAALKVLQMSILQKIQDLKLNIIKHQSFTNCLNKNIQDKNSPLFYQFIHIVYLLSFQNSIFLLKKGIFAQIIKLMDEPNSVLISMGSDIIYHVVLQGLENKKVLQILYDKFALLEKIIQFLFNKCFQNNQYLHLMVSTVLITSEEPSKGYNYFNKYVFFNIFKIIYCLSAGINRKNKKFAFSRRLSLQLIISIRNVIKDLFNFQNYSLMSIILREQINFSNVKKFKQQENIPFYKIMYRIIQQMTYNTQNKPIQVLRQINSLKKFYCNNLTKYFPLKDLEAENIPIYINFQFNLQFGVQKKIIKRDIPHKFQFYAIKEQAKHIVAKIYEIKQTQIQQISIKSGSKVIQNQVGYKGVFKKVLDGKQQFVLSLEIINLSFKSKKNNLSRSFVNGFSGSIRSNNISNILNNSIMTRSRFQNNPNRSIRQNQKKDYYSPFNTSSVTYRQREYSPSFGYIGNKNR